MVFEDNGDGILDVEADRSVQPSTGTAYTGLDFGRYFVVSPDYQVPGFSRTVLSTPEVQEVVLDPENRLIYLGIGYWHTALTTVSVFYDTNMNGLWDEGESPLSGSIRIFTSSSGSGFYVEDGVSSEFWRPEGRERYSLASPFERNYRNLVATTPNPLLVEYEAGTFQPVEIGVVQGAAFQGVIYSDITGDGLTPDDEIVTEYEFGRFDASIRVHGETLWGQPIDLTPRTLGSRYEAHWIYKLPPGSYTAELVVGNPELRLFPDNSISQAFEVGVGEIAEIDLPTFFAWPVEEQLRFIGNSVYGNLPFGQGVTVGLYRDNGDRVFDPKTDTLLAESVTDAERRYSLPGFGPGTYFVAGRIGAEFSPLEILVAQLFDAESSAKPVSLALTFPHWNLEGSVYVDVDRDNQFDPREPGIPDVTLLLQGTDVYGNAISLQTITSQYRGSYAFRGLLPGTYSIIELQPGGFENGAQTIGSLGGKSLENRFDEITIGAGLNGTGYDFNEYGPITHRQPRPEFGADVGVYDPRASALHLRVTGSESSLYSSDFQYGVDGWQAIAGDWDNDGSDSVGLFDPELGVFRLKNQNRNTSKDDDLSPFRYGGQGFVALAGDWNWNEVDSVGVYDPKTSSFYLRNSNSSGIADAGQFTFGNPGWIPLVGDWDGDGYDGIGVYDPQTATFYLRNTLSAGAPEIEPFNYGLAGWKPLAGDWDRDGIVTIGVYNPDTATFFLRNSNNSGEADLAPVNYGGARWEPIAGNWDTIDATLKTVRGRPISGTVIVSSGSFRPVTPISLTSGFASNISSGSTTASLSYGTATDTVNDPLAVDDSALEEAVSLLAEAESDRQSNAPGGSITIWNLAYIDPNLERDDESGELLEVLAADQLLESRSIGSV